MQTDMQLLHIPTVMISTKFRDSALPRLRDSVSWPPLVTGARSHNLGPILSKRSVKGTTGCPEDQ